MESCATHQPLVLVVEDESLVALDICTCLERHGYAVAGPVDNGEEAYKLAVSCRPDVVLMDIILNGDIDGVTTGARISDATGIPIIFLTAHADQRTIERARIVEPSAYLVKPFDETELHASLQMVIYKNEQSPAEVLASTPSFSDDISADPYEIIRASSFFSDLSDREVSLIAGTSERRPFRAGDFITDADGEQPAFIVCSGRVSVMPADGIEKELIVDLIGPGDLYGLLRAVDQEDPPFRARANRDSTLLLVPKKSFLLMLDLHPKLAIQIAQHLSSKLKESHAIAEGLAYRDVFSRICLVLMRLTERFGVEQEEAGVILVEITRQELASMTGATTETVVRVLKEVEKLGAVRLGKRKAIEVVDLRRLIELSSGSSGKAPTG